MPSRSRFDDTHDGVAAVTDCVQVRKRLGRVVPHTSPRPIEMDHRCLQHIADLVVHAGHDLAEYAEPRSSLKLRVQPQQLVVGPLKILVGRGQLAAASPVGLRQEGRKPSHDVENEKVKGSNSPCVRHEDRGHQRPLRALEKRDGEITSRGDPDRNKARPGRERDAHIGGEDRIETDILGSSEAAAAVHTHGDEGDIDKHAQVGLEPRPPAPVRGQVVGPVEQKAKQRCDTDHGVASSASTDAEEFVDD